jgi:3D (Asp-Asp-Asp) domain-containing protein
MKRVLSESAGLKIVATLVAVVTFVLLHEATTSDSREVAGTDVRDSSSISSGTRLAFVATAYCKGTTTASGVSVRTGIAAADADLLPVGSVVNVATDNEKYNGVYTVMDTGPRVRGRVLDLYMWSCYEALDFGRKDVDVTVLRLGWNPSASSPGLIDRLFRRREAAQREAAESPAPVPEQAQPDAAVVEQSGLASGDENEPSADPVPPDTASFGASP